jgi:acetyl esterase/lipase
VNLRRFGIRIAVFVVLAAALSTVLSRWPQSPAKTPLASGATADLDVAYGDHPRQRFDVYLPAEQEGPFPTVMWIHPGGWFLGDKGDDMPVWDWTDRGYAVVAINYRLAVGGGTIADSVADALAATQHILQNAESWSIDRERVGVYGFSAGGHLAAMITSHEPGIAAVVIAGAPTDFRSLVDPATAIFEERGSADAAAEIRLRLGCAGDCATQVESLSPALQSPGPAPILIVHGAADTIVDVAQARTLATAWTEAGGTVDLVIVSGGGHEANHPQAGIEQFFSTHLAVGRSLAG